MPKMTPMRFLNAPKVFSSSQYVRGTERISLLCRVLKSARTLKCHLNVKNHTSTSRLVCQCSVLPSVIINRCKPSVISSMESPKNVKVRRSWTIFTVTTGAVAENA